MRVHLAESDFGGVYFLFHFTESSCKILWNEKRALHENARRRFFRKSLEISPRDL